MKFSERYGYTESRSVAQVESMDDALRTGLWNVTYMRYLSSGDRFHYTQGIDVFRGIWAIHLHEDVSKYPDSALDCARAIQPYFLTGEWFVVYDLVQAIVEANPEADLIKSYNGILEMHLSGYRIVDEEVTRLTEPEEVAEVEAALQDTSRFAGAQHALRNALTLYSRLQNPDYANSIKESISAVEAIAREMTGKPNLGSAMDQIKRDHPGLHQGLVTGWKALYGYASDEPAIRHGGSSAPQVNQSLARYFLVTCASMVNYLISLGA